MFQTLFPPPPPRKVSSSVSLPTIAKTNHFYSAEFQVIEEIPPNSSGEIDTCFFIPNLRCCTYRYIFTPEAQSCALFAGDCNLALENINETHACFSNLTLTEGSFYHYVCVTNRCRPHHDCYSWEVRKSFEGKLKK